jgi:hypothetical protein
MAARISRFQQGSSSRYMTQVICKRAPIHRRRINPIGLCPGHWRFCRRYFASARFSPFGAAAEHSSHFGGASQIVLRSWFV